MRDSSMYLHAITQMQNSYKQDKRWTQISSDVKDGAASSNTTSEYWYRCIDAVSQEKVSFDYSSLDVKAALAEVWCGRLTTVMPEWASLL